MVLVDIVGIFAMGSACIISIKVLLQCVSIKMFNTSSGVFLQFRQDVSSITDQGTYKRKLTSCLAYISCVFTKA